MTATLRLDPWTLRPRTGNGALAHLLDRPIGVLPPRMIAPQSTSGRAARRARIWELSANLHCSIVGTCLSTGELRQVLAKASIPTDPASEHALHSQGVSLAALHDGRGKRLHKALDRRHRSAIARFDKAATVDEVRSLWREATRQGDIPGAYWAALTHPATDDALVREIFGEVHMLSHLVGAANRADIRRLSELEAENARLREKLARQQDHLRDGIAVRDARIRDLNGLLAQRLAHQDAEGTPDEQTLRALVADLERRLRSQTRRRAAVDERLARTVGDLDRERERRRALERGVRTLGEELEAIESSFGPPAEQPDVVAVALAGRSLLYVGGRKDRLGHLRQASARLGTGFLHHDGGLEDRSGLLGGLVSRADMVMFPVDCISHDAASAVKRLCRQMAKPFMPLRSNGMGSFVSALNRWAVGPG